MQIVIAGSRKIRNRADGMNTRADIARIADAVKFSHFTVSSVLSGKAMGPDRAAAAWATQNSIPVNFYPAKWAELGRGAGYARNLEMAKAAEAGIILWDAKSNGAKHMWESLLAAHKPVILIQYEVDPGAYVDLPERTSEQPVRFIMLTRWNCKKIPIDIAG